MKNILESPDQYGFILESKDYYADQPVQQLYIDSSIENIADFAQSIGTNYHVIKTLNPWLRSNSLTVKKKTYKIKAPLNE